MRYVTSAFWLVIRHALLLLVALWIVHALLGASSNGYELASFGAWCQGVLVGDLGVSQAYRQGTPVLELVSERLAMSLTVMGRAAGLLMGVMLVVGWRWSRPDPSLGRKIGQAVIYLFSAVPIFVLAFWAIRTINPVVFSLVSRDLWSPPPQWFPLPRPDGEVRVWIASLLLVVGDGTLLRGVRGATSEFGRIRLSEYWLFALGMGAHPVRTLVPAAVSPLTKQWIHRVVGMFGGAVVVESILNVPGMGNLTWQGAVLRDGPVLLGATLIWASAYTVLNICSALFCLRVEVHADNDWRAGEQWANKAAMASHEAPEEWG